MVLDLGWGWWIHWGTLGNKGRKLQVNRVVWVSEAMDRIILAVISWVSGNFSFDFEIFVTILIIASIYQLYYYKNKNHIEIFIDISRRSSKVISKWKKSSKNLLYYGDGGRGVGWLYTNDGTHNFNLLALGIFSISLLTEKKTISLPKMTTQNHTGHKNVKI